MTSPGTEVNVGSIIARVGLDTSGLKKGEADGASALKRTTQHLDATAKQADKVQRSVDKASGAIKRNADANIESIRRQTQATRQAQRETSRSSRSGAASGAIGGALFGTVLSEGLQNLGNGQGGRRDAIAQTLSASFTGGAIGASVAGPAGGAVGALAGGLGGLLKNNATLLGADPAAGRRADEIAAKILINDTKVQTSLVRTRQFTDELGRAQLRLADAYNHVRSASAARTDAGARGAVAGIVSPLVGGSFDEHARSTQGDVGKATDKLVTAQRRLQDAQDRVDKLSVGRGGASKASLFSAEASVSAAREAVRRNRGNTEANALRLQAAEARLAELRKGGTVDTKALATAERHLAEARDKVTAAEKGAKDAGAPVSLNTKTLLDRLRVKSADVQALDKDTRTLVKKGLSAPVIEELLRTEKDAPGTVHNVAASISHAQVVAFNRQQAALDKAAKDLIQAPLDRAYEDAKRAAEKNAQALATTTEEALRKAFAGIGTSPNTPPVAKLPGQAPGSALPKDPLAPLFPSLLPPVDPSEPDPLPSGHRKPNSYRAPQPISVVKNYNLPNATIVASNPQQLEKELESRGRLREIGGGV